MKWTLLNPGPVNLCSAVREAAVKIDLCHRQEEFINILLDVKKRLLKLAGKEESYISMLSGSGALAVESGLQSLVRGRVLVINNGHYCNRIIDSLVRMGNYIPQLKVVGLYCGFGLAPDSDKLSELLDKCAFDWVAVVHHETSTGLLNPLTEICDVVKLHDIKVFVDAVSSFGVHYVDQRADVICFNSNKCLESIPGIAAVVWDKSLECQQTIEYIRLWNYVDDKMPFTANTNAVVALQAALDCYDKEDRPRRYARVSRQVREIGSQYFDLFLSKNYSDVLTSFSFSGDYDALYAKAKASGFVLYPGKMNNYFRVANINPMLDKACVEKLFACIGENE